MYWSRVIDGVSMGDMVDAPPYDDVTTFLLLVSPRRDLLVRPWLLRFSEMVFASVGLFCLLFLSFFITYFFLFSSVRYSLYPFYITLSPGFSPGLAALYYWRLCQPLFWIRVYAWYVARLSGGRWNAVRSWCCCWEPFSMGLTLLLFWLLWSLAAFLSFLGSTSLLAHYTECLQALASDWTPSVELDRKLRPVEEYWRNTGGISKQLNRHTRS